MCAHALNIMQIKRVVYGCSNDKFGGTGSIFSLHLHPLVVQNYPMGYTGYKLRPGVMQEKAISLLQSFYEHGNLKLPEDKR